MPHVSHRGTQWRCWHLITAAVYRNFAAAMARSRARGPKSLREAEKGPQGRLRASARLDDLRGRSNRLSLRRRHPVTTVDNVDNSETIPRRTAAPRPQCRWKNHGLGREKRQTHHLTPDN